jgi:spore coat polysaccharide biosynthesis protein SpsF
MGSERLPGKTLAPLAGAPALGHLIGRLRRSRNIHGIVVATTTRPEDDAIRDFGRSIGVTVFSGSSEDVLDRTLRAAELVEADVIVQVTGDCPLIDPDITDRVIEAYMEERPDYASNVEPATYPNGLDTEVFATGLLRKVAGLTSDPADREHVSLFIRERPDQFRQVNVEAPPHQRWPALRLTLDTPEDYRLIGRIFDSLWPENPYFGLDDVLRLLREQPHLLELNRSIEQKPVR